MTKIQLQLWLLNLTERSSSMLVIPTSNSLLQVELEIQMLGPIELVTQPSMLQPIQPSMPSSIQPSMLPPIQPSMPSSIQPSMPSSIQPSMPSSIQPSMPSSNQPSMSPPIQSLMFQLSMFSSIKPSIFPPIQSSMLPPIKLSNPHLRPRRRHPHLRRPIIKSSINLSLSTLLMVEHHA